MEYALTLAIVIAIKIVFSIISQKIERKNRIIANNYENGKIDIRDALIENLVNSKEDKIREIFENDYSDIYNEKIDEEILNEWIKRRKHLFSNYMKFELEGNKIDEYLVMKWLYVYIKRQNIQIEEFKNIKEKYILEKINYILESIKYEIFIDRNNEKVRKEKEESELISLTSEIDKLIGLNKVKQEIKPMINYIKIQHAREKKGLKTSSMSNHMVFVGNPGTGKTEVARKLAVILKSLGIIEKDTVLEVDRSKLVAKYIGQTAIKTNEIIDQALGGILFIDEAYDLCNDKDCEWNMGQEAIDTLLKRMEDDRNKLVVILAGCEKEMVEFINSNMGLKSRFKNFIKFDNYDEEELYEIMKKITNDRGYYLDKKCKEYMLQKLKNIDKNNYSFSNARYIRNIVEKSIINQSQRLSRCEDIYNLLEEELSTIIVDDLAV